MLPWSLISLDPLRQFSLQRLGRPKNVYLKKGEPGTTSIERITCDQDVIECQVTSLDTIGHYQN